MPKGGRGGKRVKHARSASGKIREYKRINGKGYIDGREVLDKPPAGFVLDRGATTAPIGTNWYSNNKSRFSGQRKSVLVKSKYFKELYK